MTTYNEMYVAVLRKERLHLLSLHNPNHEGTGHYNTAAGVLEQRIKEILSLERNTEEND